MREHLKNIIVAFKELGGEAKPKDIVSKVAEYEGIAEISRKYTEDIWANVEKHCSDYKTYEGSTDLFKKVPLEKNHVKWALRNPDIDIDNLE